MAELTYQVWHHLHNSFIVMTVPILSAQTIQKLCHEAQVDGLLTYQVPKNKSELFEVKQFFNDDASTAPYCGNAHLCVATLAHELGYSSVKFGHAEVRSQSISKQQLRFSISPFSPLEARVSSFEVPLSEYPEWESLPKVGFALAFGGPHLVFFVPESLRRALLSYEIVSQDTLVRVQFDPTKFKHGVNLTFAFLDQKGQPSGSITFERGCARYTLASTSSMISALTVMIQQGKVAMGNPIDWAFTQDTVSVTPNEGQFELTSYATFVTEKTQERVLKRDFTAE